MLPQLR